MKNKVCKVFMVLSILVVLYGSICAEKPVYLDSKAPVEKRVADLLQRMTLEEKVAQMAQIDSEVFKDKNTYNESLITQIITNQAVGSMLSGGSSDPANSNEPLEWIKMINKFQKAASQSRLKIPLIYGIDAVHGQNNIVSATIYPHNLALASTWNPELVEKAAVLTAKDIQATGSNWTFAPDLDVARDIRWGRTYETFGEDPYVVSKMGVAAIKGFQKENRIIACAKHFLGYSGAYNGADRNPTDVSDRTLREIFLPPFIAAVKAGVGSFMIDSGEVNGVPAHASHYLLTEILRNELGFKGFTVTDWGDISKLNGTHKTAQTAEEAVYQGVMAGVDMNMVSYNNGFIDILVSLVKQGRIPEKVINDAVRPILEAKFRLGLFENPYVSEQTYTKVLGSKESHEAALTAARQSVVLLRNEGNVLPLSSEAKNIVITGPTADSLSMLCGGWTIDFTGLTSDKQLEATDGLTVFSALQSKLPSKTTLNFVKGYNMKNQIYVDNVKEALKTADVCILSLGEKPYAEGQGDVQDASLPKEQADLVKIALEAGKPVILVMISGRPLILTEVNAKVKAVLWSFLPGSEGGNAIADVLLGKYNPSGKLPITIPRNMGQLPLFYNCKTTVAYNPLYSFGFGLSYTTFDYSDLKVKEKVAIGDNIEISVKVKNTGKIAGDEVVILYLKDAFRTVTPLRQEVKGFSRVSLQPGEEKTVKFTVTPEQLMFYNVNMKRVTEAGKYTVLVGGEQADFTLE